MTTRVLILNTNFSCFIWVFLFRIFKRAKTSSWPTGAFRDM